MSHRTHESHSIRLHPQLWSWAREDAEPCGYKVTGLDGLISGLVIYNHAFKQRHWLTADVINDPARLEQLIAQILAHDASGVEMAWMERQIKAMFTPRQNTEWHPARTVRLSGESRSVRFHPSVWEWALADAEPCGYDGGASGLIAGLILYNHGLNKRRHWLTPDAVADDSRLEELLVEIEEHNALGDCRTWWDHRMEEMILPRQTQN